MTNSLRASTASSKGPLLPIARNRKPFSYKVAAPPAFWPPSANTPPSCHHGACGSRNLETRPGTAGVVGSPALHQIWLGNGWMGLTDVTVPSDRRLPGSLPPNRSSTLKPLAVQAIGTSHLHAPYAQPGFGREPDAWWCNIFFTIQLTPDAPKPADSEHCCSGLQEHRDRSTHRSIKLP